MAHELSFALRVILSRGRCARFGLRSIVIATLVLSTFGQSPKFYEDDPLWREPATQDASGARARGIDLMYDLAKNLLAVPRNPPPVRAGNVNSIDEVPDSEWFTNRIAARPLSLEELLRGPDSDSGPAPGGFVVIRAKQSGITPGFTLRDSKGQVWYVQFDAPGRPEAATGAAVVATKLFHALGYFQVENYLAVLDPATLEIAPEAQVETPSGRFRQMDRRDIAKVLSRAHRNPDGNYRMLASRQIPGRIIGGFKYQGTRRDDPNDVVPHEHRRELRALKVFGAWINLVDMKALNTLDTVIEVDGGSVVRHYLQDVGSTFGTGALAPREWDEGHEYVFEGEKTWKRLVTFGFYRQPWQSIPYAKVPEIGRFEGHHFDPATWKPRAPTAAFLNALPDDDFWAARRVMAFTDEMLREVVKVGQYSDPAAERHLADVLIQRRDKIGQAFLSVVNPLVNFRLESDGWCSFENVAVDSKVAEPPAGGYQARWWRFDNLTGDRQPVGSEVRFIGTRIRMPADLKIPDGGYLGVEVVALDPTHTAWASPISAYFRKSESGWKTVGLERTHAGPSTVASTPGQP